MADLITRQAAIDTLDKHLRTTDVPVSYPGIISALTEWLNELPSAQPESKELSFTHKALDTISRQAAIEAIDKIFPADPMRDDYTQGITCGAALANIYVGQLPSAQADMSEYSDKLWKAAYERGKAEAQQGWIPFKTRPLTEEEKEENPEWDCILDCKLPEDGQAILISVNIRGHESVQYDEFYTDDGSYLDSGYEIGDEAVAWMPLPEAYAERRTDEHDDIFE